jgi:predicted RNase H-related nuclease YkuK (DUF458 family)
MAEIKYFNPTIGTLPFKKVVEEIIKFIKEDVNKNYHLIIGSDSEGLKRTVLVNAIVIHRVGSGGRYFWRKIYKGNIHSLRERIYEEVNFSISTALNLLKILENHKEVLSKANLEIHVDVGENGETKSLIKEIVGMVHGYGLNVKTKPEAYGATIVADRCI